MNLEIFPSVLASKKGSVCTLERFNAVADSAEVRHVISTIRKILSESSEANDPGKVTEYKEQIAALKKKLPVICWQSSFVDHHRLDKNAAPSGLFMIDIDGITPLEMMDYIQRAKDIREQAKIVYIGETPKYGVRIVAECWAGQTNISDCQLALFDLLCIPENHRDEACIDWARCSYMVSREQIHYFDEEIFSREPSVVYENATFGGGEAPKAEKKVSKPKSAKEEAEKADSGQDSYDGLPLYDICLEWLRSNGGEPTEGSRNTMLFKLALRMRFICDFNEQVLFRVMPAYGLSSAEMRQIIHQANVFARSADMPGDLRVCINKMKMVKALGEFVDNEDNTVPLEDINNTSKTPALPPVFNEWYQAAPEDFKFASVAIQLPILGALGSKLRARYLDGSLHSPSFQVSLEAPQASGKSFMRKIADYDLSLMKEHDINEREKEREYKEKVAQLKLTNAKVDKKNREEILGAKPTPIIRYCPATMSITQLLQRMYYAQGLHLFAMAEEVDTVHKAFKRGFSSFSDALRCAFDNAEYGQDYASENSFSGIVNLYYNVLYSGTPKAMRRFYPDVEDGLVSRVLFVTLPDQFGKPYQEWAPFTEEQTKIVELGLLRLNEISIQGENVQDIHEMSMPWLNKELANWVRNQQELAVQTDDRTRDTFCRRAAVVGFRAGMLAHFLWGEQDTTSMRRKVINFAKWIANHMLKQHISRFSVNVESNTKPYEDLFNQLPDEFGPQEVESVIKASGKTAVYRQVVYRWLASGMIVVIGKKRSPNRRYRKDVK